MPSEHVNRETVERRMERLQDEYDDPYVEEIHQEGVPPERFEALREVARDGYTGGAYCWVVREPDQTAELTESMPDGIEDERSVLMILGRGGTEWGLAGGGREDSEVDQREPSERASGGSRERGETYEQAAVREVREETSVACEVTDCFLLRRVRTDSAGEHGERLHALYVFFDARYVDGHIEIQPGELNGAAWFADPPGRMQPANEFRAAEFWEEYEAEDPLDDHRD